MENCSLATTTKKNPPKLNVTNAVTDGCELNEKMDVVYEGNVAAWRGDSFNTRSWRIRRFSCEEKCPIIVVWNKGRSIFKSCGKSYTSHNWINPSSKFLALSERVNIFPSLRSRYLSQAHPSSPNTAFWHLLHSQKPGNKQFLSQNEEYQIIY